MRVAYPCFDPITSHILSYLLGQQSDEFLESNIRSGQLRQSLGALSSALNSDNYNSVVANIGQGMDPNDGRHA